MVNKIYDLEKVVNSGLTTSIQSSRIKFDQLTIEIQAENINKIILFLKNNEKCKFKQLIEFTAVYFAVIDKRFMLVYILLSHENNLRIIINTNIKEKTSVPSITKIFPSANWMEREVFDMYGIVFNQHPNLKRILTDYKFEGYPLRKDFPLTGHNEVRYNEYRKKVIYEPVKLEQNYRNFDYQSPWEGTKYIKEKTKE